ncbi:hypothetical protein DYB32_010864, partial [Aphanomyces invadans]
CCMFEDAAGDTLSPAAALERLCKQETPQYSAQDHIQLALWDLYAMVAAPSVYFDPRDGCALLFSSSCPIQALEDVTPVDLPANTRNRYLVVKGRLAGFQVYIHVVYAFTGEDSRKADFFNSLPFDFEDSARHIVCGDFNLVLDPSLDKVVASHRRSQGLEELERWMTALGVVDSWRLSHPDRRVYSNPTHSNRIDYVFLSGAFHQENLQSIRYQVDKYQAFFHNDHAPVVFSLAANSFQHKKKAPWRCPPWVLALPEVRQHITFTLKCTMAGLLPKEDPNYNPAKVLDDHLFHDKKYLQSVVSAQHEEDLRDCDQRRGRIADLSTALAATPSEALAEELVQAKQDLQDALRRIKERNELDLFREQVDSQEKCSRIFLRPPVSQQRASKFPVKDAQDWDIQAAHCRRYWGKIFHTTSADAEAPAQDLNLSLHSEILQHTTARLTEDQKTFLEAPLTPEEFSSAIRSGPKNKAPGPDGMPYEYFQVNSNLWGAFLAQVHDFNFSRKRMTDLQRKASL